MHPTYVKVPDSRRKNDDVYSLIMGSNVGLNLWLVLPESKFGSRGEVPIATSQAKYHQFHTLPGSNLRYLFMVSDHYQASNPLSLQVIVNNTITFAFDFTQSSIICLLPLHNSLIRKHC